MAAKYISAALSKIISPVVQEAIPFIDNDLVSNLGGIASKALRLKIIYERKKGPSAQIDAPLAVPDWSDPVTGITAKEEIEFNRENNGVNAEVIAPQNAYKPKESTGSKPSEILKDPIKIINLDSGPEVGIPKYDYLTLSSVPKELDYNPNSSFVGIASIGRNNPHYQYTGSEDTLEFSIDWYSDHLNRTDVIANCRWVEALTKADGYNKNPPRVKLQWGDLGFLFGDDTWLLTAAPYKLSNFQSAYRDPSSGDIVKIGSLPQQAYQNITLKRITNNNRTHLKIKNVAGISDDELKNGNSPIPTANINLF